MNQRVKTIFEEAQKLAPDEREELAELLLATIEVAPAIEKAWLVEIEQRIEAHERGDVQTKPAAEVLAKHLKR